MLRAHKVGYLIGAGGMIFALASAGLPWARTPELQSPDGRIVAWPARVTVPARPTPGLRITEFFVSPGVVAEGGKTMVCYGVSRAVSVSILPSIGPAPAADARCFSIRPAASGALTLIARGAGGESESRTVWIGVAPREQRGRGVPLLLASARRR